MSSREEYNEAKRKAEAALAEARGLVKDVFEKEAFQILEDFNIDSYSWTQYTPYFNDGDECIFSVHADYPYVNGFDYYGDAANPDDDEVEPVKLSQAVYSGVANFLNSFSEDDMKWMFGDHVEVTVSREGIKETEYYHD